MCDRRPSQIRWSVRFEATTEQTGRSSEPGHLSAASAVTNSLLVAPGPVEPGNDAFFARDEVAVGARLARQAVAPVPANADDRTFSKLLRHLTVP